ncbi:formylmethanofuran dehydrogenase [Methanoculleus sp. FWC-SCC1]|uniref:Formylmethanofuran dehydrogenase n=1 Tax=Methanoculleus frigidifontis TaxID=2584085 RepID=A0ABT8M8W4_9EURY|nr:FmdE family protein [Methanoculleus sp. FWC-SCC1]MDN7024372.1 formylmethanofuran dehydrogenase [Methanoculleus sp. FWC-SCC1]
MHEDVSPGTGSADQPGSQEPEILPLSEVARFHGHLCPGVALGYLAAKIAIRKLRPDRDMDGQLVAIVENGGCSLNAIQAAAGCTMGKGNLIIRNHGKNVYTFINKATNDAVRLSVKDRETDEDPVFKALMTRAVEGTASPEDMQELQSRMKQQVDAMLAEPPETHFDIRHVTVEIPKKSHLATSVKCSKCGEMVAESRARVQNGSFVCIPCFDEHTRGR